MAKDKWEADVIVKTPVAKLRFPVKGIYAITRKQAQYKIETQARKMSGAKDKTEIKITNLRLEEP